MPDAAYGSGATAAILRARRASLRPAKLNDWSLRSLMEPRNFPLDKDTEMFLKWRSVQRALKTVLRDPIYNKRVTKHPTMASSANRKPSSHSFAEVSTPLGAVRTPPDALMMERLAMTLSPRMTTKRWSRRVSSVVGVATAGEASRARAERGGEAAAREEARGAGVGAGAAAPWRTAPQPGPRLRVSAARRGPRSKWAAPAAPASPLTRGNEGSAKGRCMGSVSSEHQLRPQPVAPVQQPRSASTNCRRRKAALPRHQLRLVRGPAGVRSGAAGDPLAPPSSPQPLLPPRTEQSTKVPPKCSSSGAASVRFQEAGAGVEGAADLEEQEQQRHLLEQAAAVGAARQSKDPAAGPPPARDRPPSPEQAAAKPRSQPISPLPRLASEVRASSDHPGSRRMRQAASAAATATRRTPSVKGRESPREEKAKVAAEAEAAVMVSGAQPGRDLEGVLSKWAAETFTEHLEQPFVSEDDIPGLARKAAGPAPVPGSSALVSHALLLESLAAMKRARRTRHADAARRGHAGLVRGIRAWAERSLREAGWKGPRLTTTFVPSPPPPPPSPPPGSYPRTRSSVRSTLA